jgi:hypothetical protein
VSNSQAAAPKPKFFVHGKSSVNEKLIEKNGTFAVNSGAV